VPREVTTIGPDIRIRASIAKPSNILMTNSEGL
jgi:hypothetical protein